MAITSCCPYTKVRFFDSAGDPLAGGKVYFYEPGGSFSTPKDTYSDYAGITANANPVILDAYGEATIRLSGLYDVKVLDSSDVLQHSFLNFVNADDSKLLTHTTGGSSGTISYAIDQLESNVTTLQAPTAYNAGSLTGAIELDLADGEYQYGTVTGATTLTFTGWPASGKVGAMTLEITNAGTSITWPAAMDWVGGNEPSFTAAGVDIIELLTRDNGTTILGWLAGADMK